MQGGIGGGQLMAIGQQPAGWEARAQDQSGEGCRHHQDEPTTAQLRAGRRPLFAF
jgi:hypothetical protein